MNQSESRPIQWDEQRVWECRSDQLEIMNSFRCSSSTFTQDSPGMGQFVLGVRSKLFGSPSLHPYCPLAHSVLSLPLPPWISSVEGGPSFSLSSSPLPVSPCKPLLPLSVREACGSSSPLRFWVLLGRAGPTGINPPLPHKFSSNHNRDRRPRRPFLPHTPDEVLIIRIAVDLLF